MNEYKKNIGNFSIDGNKIRVQKISGVDSVLFEDIASISYRQESIPKKFGIIAFNTVLFITVCIQLYLVFTAMYIASLIVLGIGLILAIILGFSTSKPAFFWDSVIIETRGGRILTYAVGQGRGGKEMENIENARRKGSNKGAEKEVVNTEAENQKESAKLDSINIKQEHVTSQKKIPQKKQNTAGCITFIVMFFIGGGLVYFFSGSGSGILGPKYTECECVDFFNTHLGSLWDYSSSRTSEITDCIETYVYSSEGGRKNVNACFDQAWEDVKRTVNLTDPAFDFAARAADCNCN